LICIEGTRLIGLIDRHGITAQCECTNPCNFVRTRMSSPRGARMGGLTQWK